MFESEARVVWSRGWQAYAFLKPLSSLHVCGAYRLAERFFDLSAMQCVIDTMETQLISARNVARLIRDNVQQIK
jgi:hypothetical protein